MTKLLIEGGCFGDWGHGQRLDSMILRKAPDLIVWRRSLPHARQWPPFCDILREINGAGYEAMVIVMVRERKAMAASQKLRGHIMTIAQGYSNIRTAYDLIFGALISVKVDDWILMPFESLMMHGGVLLPKQFDDWGLPAPRTTITDANLKHY